MSYEYFTIVAASPGFWEKHFKRTIDKKLPFEITFISAKGIMIWSENRTPLEYIVKLSKENPKEVFRIKIYGEDVYNNYVYLYECSNGDYKIIKEGYEYIFSGDSNAINKIDKDVLREFESKAVSLFKKIDHSSEKVFSHLYFDENENEFEEDIDGLSVIVKYRTKNAWLIAKLQGLTHIWVDVEFFDEPNKIKPPETVCQIDKK